MIRPFSLAASVFLAGCAVSPAPLLTVPAGHPAHADSGDVPYQPPPDPFKDEPAPPAVPAPPQGEHRHEGAAPAKPYPLDVCLVSGAKLGSMGKPAVIVHDGRELRFCCPACEPTFKADPAKYLKKLDDAVKKHEGHP